MNRETGMKSIFSILLALSCAGTLAARSDELPAEVKPVENFNVERYLGDWYEIGRFDFKWEKNMKNVRANYSMNENGSIKVTNSGYDYVSGKDKQSIGKAKFAGKQKDIGKLKVSFFGPFYSAYTVIALDDEYKYALIAGANDKLLWMLSRTPYMPDEVKENYIRIAQAAGYDLADFIWTVQE